MINRRSTLVSCATRLALVLMAGNAYATDTKATPGTASENTPVAASLPGTTKPLLSSVVEGIVSYTKWPADLKQVRLCIIGEGPSAKELLKSGALGTLGSAQRAIDVQRAANAGDGIQDCQVMYFSARYTTKQRATLNRYVARPFLTIGEGAEFCSDGGMFCVDADESTGRFGVNLDAVARSGLRVNPQVLSLGRAKAKASP